MIKQIVEAVSIPVMAKVRIGHFVEAQVATLPVKYESLTDYLRLVDITKHWHRLHRRVRSAYSRG